MFIISVRGYVKSCGFSFVSLSFMFSGVFLLAPRTTRVTLLMVVFIFHLVSYSLILFMALSVLNLVMFFFIFPDSL